VVSGTEQKNSTSPFLPCMSQRGTKELKFTPEIDCDQPAMGLPSVMSVIFLRALCVSATPSGIKRECECLYEGICL
jgi:hypothetical protein